MLLPHPNEKMNNLKGRSKVEMFLLFCPPKVEAKELPPLHHSPPKKKKKRKEKERKEGKEGRRKREKSQRRLDHTKFGGEEVMTSPSC